MIERSIQLKTRGELQAMRASGLVLARAIVAGRAAVAPGVSTLDVNDAVAAVIADAGATSNFLHYGARGADPGFPATICASVNSEIVHGIPSATRILRDRRPAVHRRRLHPGRLALRLRGLGARGRGTVDGGGRPDRRLRAGDVGGHRGRARPDGRLGDLSWAIQNSVEQSGRQDGRRYGSVAGYGGHGIGTAMHMAPFVPNQGKRGKGPRLIPGMALAVEPMITLGRPATRELADGWTVVTKDGSRAAHVEHSIAITEDGVSVLTAADAGAAGLAPVRSRSGLAGLTG